jgi:hypothetical protein
MSRHEYDTTPQYVMHWAKSELEHIGRIASIKDKDLQYSYAQSTVNGMAHLKDAIFQLVNDKGYIDHKKELLVLHGKVIRAMKHLIKEYDVNLNEIRNFNTRKVLSNFSYLKDSNSKKTTRRRKT